MTTGPVTQHDVEQFLYLEASLQDEHRYDEWEALWADDALYWVPAGGDDPSIDISYIYDNRSRIASRIRQLKTGRRHAQLPPSHLSRTVSNVRFTQGPGGIEVRSTFILVEARHGKQTLWAGRTEHTLRVATDRLLMSQKKVVLVNRDDPISNLAFLI